MIKYLLRRKLELVWIIFHIILGIISTFTPYFFIGWMYLILGTSFLGLLLNQNKDGIMTYTLSYLLGTEVFSRMARSPLTGLYPDEVGKYFPLYVLIAAFLVEGKIRNNKIGWAIILLTLPSLVLTDPEYRHYGFVFNYLGIFNLALMVLYFSPKTISLKFLNENFRLIVLPLISILAFITIKTPDLDDVEFELSALHDTSGGYGSNQVSTMLGLGIMILGYFYLTKQKLFSIRYLDEILLLLFVFRGLLTFSRGGMLTPAVGLLLFYFILSRFKNFELAGRLMKRLNFNTVFPAFAGVIILVLITNTITGGALFLRYKGETVGTQKGVKEIDLNHWTSNRVDIALMDLALWAEYPLFGVGPGMSKFTEGGHLGFGSHVEFSRLPAEHGIGGAIVVVLLLVYPYNHYKKLKNPLHKALFVLFIWMAIMTSFHAAMRTMLTPFFYGMAFAKFNFED